MVSGLRGELAALTAALFWAIASMIYARVGTRIAPLILNLLKGLVAIAFLCLTLLLLERPFPHPITPPPLIGLALSGIIGIGLGDTFFFRSLLLIGPRRALLIESLAPPLSALLALGFLQEILSGLDLAGILLTVGGVTWAVSERLPVGSGVISPQNLGPGIGYGLLAVVGQASGAVMSRAALAETTIDPLWSALIRIGAGTLVLLLWLGVGSWGKGGQRLGSWAERLQPVWQGVRQPRLLGGVAIAALFGTFLGIWLQQISLKYAPTGISQALSSTSQLFILPLAVWQGEALSARALLGVAASLLGIALLFR